MREGGAFLDRALGQLSGALGRGWEKPDSRAAMLLQQKRVGAAIKAATPLRGCLGVPSAPLAMAPKNLRKLAAYLRR